MQRILIVLGLTALTFVGGHFYNRRWDRAVLFFVALVVWGIGVYVRMTTRTGEVIDAGGTAALSDILSYHWRLFVIGALVLWALGLIVTYLDARRPLDATAYRWTPSGVVGAVALSALTGVFLVTQVFLTLGAVMSEHEGRAAAASASSEVRYRDRHFSNYVYLGRVSARPGDLAKAPEGEGYLRGRFTYAGGPAAGVDLSLTLNGEYQTERVVTDENGFFTFRLPAGEWTVNRLVTHRWVEYPDEGNFMIVSGREPKLANERYDEHYWLNGDGVKVTVGDESGEPQLSFVIRERIRLTWPRPDGKPARTTLGEAVVEWQPYPEADRYLVRITEMQRDGRTTSYHPVAHKELSDSTRFALAGLPAAPGDKETEYQVTVWAFAQDGTFLSESDERYNAAAFVLTDKQRLVREGERAFLSSQASDEDYEEIRDNSRRIEAIEVLLKDGLVEEAERLLGKVQGQVDPGKRSAITGYVLAKRGRCAEAKELFAKAVAEGGMGCVPAFYREACE